VVADSPGRVITFRIATGQAHELPEAIPLLETLPGVPTWVVADRGYTIDPAWVILNYAA
jgi:hypothetical protein